MTDLIERLRLGDGTSPDHLLLLEAADALEKLAQPVQESVECMCGICKLGPPQREWVGLTRKEVYDLYDSDFETFHQRIEAELKEKNT